jgi:hypothetical protein
LDGYRQFVAMQKLRDGVLRAVPRYHVEFETVASLRRKLAATGFERIEIKGAMFAPLRVLHKVSPSVATACSKWTLPREGWLSDRALSRLFAGHLVATAYR